jgi:hypothetical protein
MTEIKDLPDGQYMAVVDSIEDGLARVFFESDGEQVGDALMQASALPEAGRKADAILTVTVKSGQLAEAEYDPERTEARRDAAQGRFDKLSTRPPSTEE